MPRKKLIWHIFLSHAVVTTAALLAITAYTAKSVSQFHMDSVAKDLENRALLLLDPVRAALHDGGDVQSLVRELGSRTKTRITVILPDGTVVGDSEGDPAKMDNHGQRPEITTALAGQTGRALRYSNSVQHRMSYIALPLRDNGELLAVLRTAVPLTLIKSTLWENRLQIGVGTLIIAIFGIGVSWFVARQITHPLERLRQGAEKFAQGDFKHELKSSGSEEMAGLANTMNQMAGQLDRRIHTIVDQRNQQEAVLSSMIEGVIAVDADACIITMNHSAARLLSVDAAEAVGKNIETIVRNTSLQKFVNKALTGETPIEGECVIHGRQEQIVQTHGAVLRDSSGIALGAVIVLNDVSKLRRLEQVRQDFVANVSHELRTPITSIKGFVETLLDGALDSPEEARRFLEIVAKQSDRLTNILEDLLILSSAEAGTANKALRFEISRLSGVVDAAVALCKPKAASKQIEIHNDVPDDIEVRINAPLLEQAVTNLIDNAIKYSGPNASVLVQVERNDGNVIIRVQDHGVGILSEHLPRLFERFYRVDKARSRNLGGTGLGLSIVKHIACAHGGEVRVESTPGAGSTFSIQLPN